MAEETSLLIQLAIERLQNGDARARADLLRFARRRLERLARKMLAGFPGVRRFEEADDVLQNAGVRLWRALEEVPLESNRAFFRLAAAQIRRELIDLARHYFGPQGMGAHHAELPPQSDSSGAGGSPEVAQSGSLMDPSRLAAWSEFHQAISELPNDERDLVDLLWYQGLTQPEAAKVLQIPERTLKRYWQQLRLKLRDIWKKVLPR